MKGNDMITKLSRIFLIASMGGASFAQVPSNWATYNGTDFSFRYPADWRLEQKPNQEVQFGPPGNPAFFNLFVDTSFGGDIEGFIAAWKTSIQQLAAQRNWTVGPVRTSAEPRGGQEISFDLDRQDSLWSITGVALGIGRGPLYFLVMTTTPGRNFSDLEQFRRPILESLVFRFPRSSIEGSWQRTYQNYIATISFRPDGTYGYLIRQTQSPEWSLQVEGRFTLRPPDPNAYSDRLAVIELQPSQYQFSGLSTANQPRALVQIIAQGFPATTSEPYEVLCVKQRSLILKARQPGLGFWQPVQLSVTPPVQPAALRPVNAASSQEMAAPGSLVSIYGDFGVRESAATNLPLPSNLSGLAVTVGGRTAPLLYAGPNQVNLQLPFDMAAGVAPVSVVANGRTQSGSITIVRTAPGIFLAPGNRAVAANQNYTLNSPANSASPGSYLTVYITGQGAFRTNVAVGAPAPANPLALTLAETRATIGGRAAEVSYSGGAPGLAGVGQVNVRVPTGLTPGDHELVVIIGNVNSNGAIVSVGR